MSEPKWTPGPWRVGTTFRANDLRGHVYAARGEDMCFLIVSARSSSHSHEDLGPEQDANAHLIAAAPDLYRLLLEVPPLADLEGVVRDAWFAEREAALAKARGEVTP